MAYFVDVTFATKLSRTKALRTCKENRITALTFGDEHAFAVFVHINEHNIMCSLSRSIIRLWLLLQHNEQCQRHLSYLYTIASKKLKTICKSILAHVFPKYAALVNVTDPSLVQRAFVF